MLQLLQNLQPLLCCGFSNFLVKTRWWVCRQQIAPQSAFEVKQLQAGGFEAFSKTLTGNQQGTEGINTNSSTIQAAAPENALGIWKSGCRAPPYLTMIRKNLSDLGGNQNLGCPAYCYSEAHSEADCQSHQTQPKVHPCNQRVGTVETLAKGLRHSQKLVI